MTRTVLVVCAVLSAALLSATRAAAQDGVTLSGRLLNSLSGDPIPESSPFLVETLRDS